MKLLVLILRYLMFVSSELCDTGDQQNIAEKALKFLINISAENNIGWNINYTTNFSQCVKAILRLDLAKYLTDASIVSRIFENLSDPNDPLAQLDIMVRMMCSYTCA